MEKLTICASDLAMEGLSVSVQYSRPHNRLVQLAENLGLQGEQLAGLPSSCHSQNYILPPQPKGLARVLGY